MKPFQNSRPARVTANAGTPTRAKKKPWMAPATLPVRMARTSASHSAMPCVTASTAKVAPATPLTEPTDRSISPSSRTKTIPTAIMPVPTMATEMSERLPAVRKFEFRLAKIAQMMIRPMTTGIEPRSPPRSLRLNSPM